MTGIPGQCDDFADASQSASTLSEWDEDFIIEDEERCNQSGLPSFPLELLQDHLAPLLSNRDIKHLRATCDQLAFKLLPCLRFPRLFISPCYKNIEVFNAVCAHPIFRGKVEEIVWDAALLEMPKGENLVMYGQLIRLDPFAADLVKILFAEERRTAFRSACESAYLQWPNQPIIRKKVVAPELGKDNLGGSACRMRSSRCSRWFPVPDLQIVEETIPPPPTWRGLTADAAYLIRYTELYGPSSDPPFDLRLSQAYFEVLVREQEEIITSGADMISFLAGIASLPNLKRIRITNHTYSPDHLWSSYPTPLIRSHPYGFRMPYLPQPRSFFIFKELYPWDYMIGLSGALSASIRGLRTTPSLLASLEALILECDTNYIPEMECPTDPDVRSTLHIANGCPLIIPEPRVYVRYGIRKIDLGTWLRLAFPGSLTPKLVISAPPPIPALEGCS